MFFERHESACVLAARILSEIFPAPRVQNAGLHTQIQYDAAENPESGTICSAYTKRHSCI